MSRIAIASIAGIAGFLLYIAAAVILADLVLQGHWALQILYFAAAGILWAWPAKWLMVWAARG
jgi:membrane protein implicated in regulation of membrane protease activity